MAEVTGSPSRHQISYVRVVTAGWKRKSIHVKNCTGATALSRRPLAIEDVDPSCIQFATGGGFAHPTQRFQNFLKRIKKRNFDGLS
jgi:hypothetical protein